MKLTHTPKADEVFHGWHLVDAKGKVLGRIASEIAIKLMGKAKPYYVTNIDCGDFVVVVNANDFVVTGKKMSEKMYDSYSGYPGGRKSKALWQVRNEKPKEPLRQAVMGMLPNNKLKDRLMTRLYIFTTEDHPYKNKFVSKG
jgi:large subunit ribosomal protein L13